ncbi:MAG: histone deacetylase [Bacteroidetes bacterium]|nr:histone deacetylase [Bacteroidota bacterium]
MIRIAWSELYNHPLPAGHRFPMEKYTLLPEQLIYEGTISESQLFCPAEMHERELLMVHDIEYWQKLRNLSLSYSEIRKTGFPLSEAFIKRELTIMQGTLDAARFALVNGIAFNIAGGTHHAFSNRGEGFCLLNDLAIAAKQLINEQLVKKALIVDLDVHQGNGTAEIFKDDSDVFTFSMHGASNYPLHKEKSDLDIALRDGTGDNEYLSILDLNLKRIIDEFMPDMIFYQSGVDVLKQDKLGRLNLSIDGCMMRDKLVLEYARVNQIPMVAAMGGGYSVDIKHIVEAHANTYRLAMQIFS